MLAALDPNVESHIIWTPSLGIYQHPDTDDGTLTNVLDSQFTCCGSVT